jgi:H+-transporting ATPase
MGFADLAFCIACLAVGKFAFGLDTDALRTMAVVTLVFSGQAVFYVARERQHIWSSRPGRWLIMSSIVDLSLFGFLSSNGILMKTLSLAIVASLFVAAAAFAFVLDAVKLALFRRLAVS